MAVFTALRNKAQSGLAGLVTGAAKSALGLNRAAGLRFPSGGESKPNGDTNLLFQYPLDLGSTGNNHFISFFVRERKAAKVTQSTKKDAAEVAKKSEQVDEDGATATNSPNSESKALGDKIKSNAKKAQGRKHDGKSLTQKLAPTVRTKNSVALYFPPTVTQSYEVKYGETEMGIGTVVGADIIAGFTGFDANNMKKAMGAAMDGLRTAVTGLALQAVEMVPGFAGAGAAVGIARGKVIVPKMEVTFEGVGKRNFSYTFMFTPSSEQEADQVNSIIKLFRENSAPDYTDGLGIEMTIPNTFDIAYYTGAIENGYLHKIGECYLKNVNVTYGGDKMTFHKSNATGAPPTRTTMQLDFAELQTVTKSLIQDQGF
jgi:hypothetical protein